MRTLILALFVLVVTAGCGATITFQPVVVDDGYYYPPPLVLYYPPPVVLLLPGGPRYHDVVMCSRYQGCTHYW